MPFRQASPVAFRSQFSAVWRCLRQSPVSVIVPSIVLLWYIGQYSVAPEVGTAVNSDRWFRIFSVQTAHPEYYWSYGTAAISHISIEHLASNALVLLLLTPIIEQSTDSKTAFALIVVSGLLGTSTFVVLGTLVGIVGVGMGASGAVFGLIGFLFPGYLASKPRNRGESIIFHVSAVCTGAVAPIVVYQMHLHWGTQAALADATHLAGFAVGVLFWLAISPAGLYEEIGQ